MKWEKISKDLSLGNAMNFFFFKNIHNLPINLDKDFPLDLYAHHMAFLKYNSIVQPNTLLTNFHTCLAEISSSKLIDNKYTIFLRIDEIKRRMA